MDPSQVRFGTPSLPYSASLAGTITVAAHSYVGEIHLDPGFHYPLPDQHDPIGLLLGGVAVGVFGNRVLRRVQGK